MKRNRLIFPVFFGLMLAAGCGDDEGSQFTEGGGGSTGDAGNGGMGGQLPHIPDKLTITPYNKILELDINAPGTQAFTAIVTFEDGLTQDVSSETSFTVTNALIGAFDLNVLSVPAFPSAAAEVSLINAEYTTAEGTVHATAQL